jgi:hypothetical protein
MKGKEKGVRSRQTAHAKARGHVNPESIVSNYRRGTTWAGWLVGASFALMGVLGAWFGW